MNTALLIGGGVVILAIIGALVVFGRRQRKAGEDGAVRKQQATDLAARDRVAKVEAEARDATTTQGRLDDRTF